MLEARVGRKAAEPPEALRGGSLLGLRVANSLSRQLAQAHATEVCGVGQNVTNFSFAQTQTLHQLQGLAERQRSALRCVYGGNGVERQLRQRPLGQGFSLHHQPCLATI